MNLLDFPLHDLILCERRDEVIFHEFFIEDS